jgi:hypothetical protein
MSGHYPQGVFYEADCGAVMVTAALTAPWVGRRSEFVLGKHSGAALIRHLLDAEGEKYDDQLVRDGVDAVKAWVMQRDKKLHRLAYAARNSFIPHYRDTTRKCWLPGSNAAKRREFGALNEQPYHQ